MDLARRPSLNPSPRSPFPPPQLVLALVLACSSMASASSLRAERRLGSDCAAESRCLGSACSSAFSSQDLPYTAVYTSSVNASTTTFTILACSSSCTAGSEGCAPLQALTLRASDAVLASPSSASVTPTAAAVPGCSDAGSGLRWTGSALGDLATTSPAVVRGLQLRCAFPQGPGPMCGRRGWGRLHS